MYPPYFLRGEISFSPFILSLRSFLSFFPHFLFSFKSFPFIHCFIYLSKQGQGLNFQISFKMGPRHPPGPGTERCRHASPCQRGSPWSPTLFPSPAPQETTARPLSHALASGSLPEGLGPLPLASGPRLPSSSLPSPSLPSRIRGGSAQLFAYFYLCSLPAANQRAGRGGGGWAGLRLRLPLRRPQVPERVGAAPGLPRSAALAPGSPLASAFLPGFGQAQTRGQRGCRRGSAGARFTCTCREPQAAIWFAGASRVPRTACARSTCSTP